MVYSCLIFASGFLNYHYVNNINIFIFQVNNHLKLYVFTFFFRKGEKIIEDVALEESSAIKKLYTKLIFEIVYYNNEV